MLKMKVKKSMYIKSKDSVTHHINSQKLVEEKGMKRSLKIKLTH